jgi:simple sugar transport system ATP-binding protein
MALTESLISLHEVSKRFGSIEALTDVSLSVSAGEVLCLLGDNGAGKSTLIKVLSGVHQPSSGEMRIDGRPTGFANPREARNVGIATVHQDVGTIPMMSVGRNSSSAQNRQSDGGPSNPSTLKELTLSLSSR